MDFLDRQMVSFPLLQQPYSFPTMQTAHLPGREESAPLRVETCQAEGQQVNLVRTECTGARWVQPFPVSSTWLVCFETKPGKESKIKLSIRDTGYLGKLFNRFSLLHESSIFNLKRREIYLDTNRL